MQLQSTAGQTTDLLLKADLYRVFWVVLLLGILRFGALKRGPATVKPLASWGTACRSHQGLGWQTMSMPTTMSTKPTSMCTNRRSKCQSRSLEAEAASCRSLAARGGRVSDVNAW